METKPNRHIQITHSGIMSIISFLIFVAICHLTFFSFVYSAAGLLLGVLMAICYPVAWRKALSWPLLLVPVYVLLSTRGDGAGAQAVALAFTVAGLWWFFRKDHYQGYLTGDL